jgi:hypothetical protein
VKPAGLVGATRSPSPRHMPESPYRSGGPSSNCPCAVHRVALGRLGIPLIDGTACEELAAVCREEGRWTFLLVVAPPRIENLSGAPVNPIAIF